MKSPKCVICPSSPAGKIDLTVDNGKRRFKRHRQRKRLCPIAQRLRLTHALKVSVAEKGSVSDATSSPIALNVAVMAMMIEPTFAEQQLVGIVLSARSILIPIAGWLAKTEPQLINDQMINAYFDIGCLGRFVLVNLCRARTIQRGRRALL